jgi:adenylate cyclase
VSYIFPYNLYKLQDKIALSVAGVIEPALEAAEMRRSVARPTTDLSADDARRLPSTQ